MDADVGSGRPLGPSRGFPGVACAGESSRVTFKLKGATNVRTGIEGPASPLRTFFFPPLVSHRSIRIPSRGTESSHATMRTFHPVILFIVAAVSVAPLPGQVRIREEIVVRPRSPERITAASENRLSSSNLPLLRPYESWGVTYAGVTRSCSLDASGSLALGPSNLQYMALGSLLSLYLQAGGSDHLIYRIRNVGGTIEHY